MPTDLALERKRKSDREWRAKWRQEHLDIARAKWRKWRTDHLEQERERNRGRIRKPRSQEQRERELLQERVRQQANPAARKAARDKYRKANPDKVLEANVRRRTQKIRAMPVWADRAAITEFYTEARRLTKETNVKHVVDHIIPLRSPVVCGLHVEGNLRVITEDENNLKGNR